MAIGIPCRETVMQFLWDRINYERAPDIPYRSNNFKLDRMRVLLQQLGNPHLGLRCIHIAGTKGKGSTAAMAAGMLSAAGLRTGLYSSPHLTKIEERYAIDGQICAEADFLDLAAEIRPIVEQLDRDPGASKPTFFEITTALGFLYFQRQKVDIAVIEVGLGGRLDSTNVVQPEVAVITSISYDHMRQLGADLPSIAREKAGIIKADTPVISGVCDPEPGQVIAAQAAAANAPLRQRERDFFAEQIELAPSGKARFHYRSSGPFRSLPQLESPLIGLHQAENAAVAIAAIEALVERGWKISPEVVRTGLARAACPARVEMMCESPTVMIDAAHNLASISALLAALDACDACRTAARRTLFFGASRDKDAAGMLRLLMPYFDRIILTQPADNPRASSPEELATIANGLIAELDRPPQIEVSGQAGATFQAILHQAAPNELVCVSGSFFLAGELRALLSKPAESVP